MNVIWKYLLFPKADCKLYIVEYFVINLCIIGKYHIYDQRTGVIRLKAHDPAVWKMEEE